VKVQRLAVLTAISTFVLLLIGGLVNPTGSSLACPDWPLCFGEVFPKMEGGVLYEHSHRLAATAVGMLTVLLGISVWRTRRDQPVLRRLALLAVAMVVIQGVLGGLTVIYQLPTLVSTLHLGVSMLFFLLVSYLALRLSPSRVSRQPGLPRTLAVVALVAVYLQLILGGLVRHLGAGRVCGDDPWLCAGVLWPAEGAARLQRVHRGFGYAVMVLLFVSAHFAFHRARREGLFVAKWSALLTPVIAIAQVGLGLLTVATWIRPIVVTWHTGGGALLLLACFFTVLGFGPWRDAVTAPAGGEPARGAGEFAARESEALS